MQKDILIILSLMFLSFCGPLAIQTDSLSWIGNLMLSVLTFLSYPLPSNVSLDLFLQMTSAESETKVVTASISVLNALQIIVLGPLDNSNNLTESTVIL